MEVAGVQQPSASNGDHAMDASMDIDMDLDLGPLPEAEAIETVSMNASKLPAVSRLTLVARLRTQWAEQFPFKMEPWIPSRQKPSTKKYTSEVSTN